MIFSIAFNLVLCVKAIYNPPHDSPYTLKGNIFEKFSSEVNKQLNVHMVKSNLNTTHWILCGDLNLTSVDWNTLSGDDQPESSFLISIAKFNLGLLKEKKTSTARRIFNRQFFFM